MTCVPTGSYRPPRPSVARTRPLWFALVLALASAVTLAFLFEYLDDSLKTKEDLDAVAPDLPVLGLIPSIPSWKDKSRAQIVSLSELTTTSEQLSDAAAALARTIQRFRSD